MSERHATKVTAAVEEFDRIAADGAVDAAHKGRRRELFAAKALALKHGRPALAIEKGKMATVEKS